MCKADGVCRRRSDGSYYFTTLLPGALSLICRKKRAGSATPEHHSRTLVQHLVNEAVRLCVVTGHEIVAVRVALDALNRLTRVMGQ
jgi:hypothetical protein